MSTARDVVAPDPPIPGRVHVMLIRRTPNHSRCAVPGGCEFELSTDRSIEAVKVWRSRLTKRIELLQRRRRRERHPSHTLSGFPRRDLFIEQSRGERADPHCAFTSPVDIHALRTRDAGTEYPVVGLAERPHGDQRLPYDIWWSGHGDRIGDGERRDRERKRSLEA